MDRFISSQACEVFHGFVSIVVKSFSVEAPNPLPPLSSTMPTPVIGCHSVGVQARLDEGTLKIHILCQVESRLKHQWIVCMALGSRAASHQVDAFMGVTPVSAAVGVSA